VSHTFHDALPGYDQRQILHDGCRECEHRGKDVSTALANMDAHTFGKAWRRAFDWQSSHGGGYDATGQVSHAEIAVLKAIWGIQVHLERRGLPLDGTAPTFETEENAI